ncbi:uncharacterized protein LOC141711255 [Apium graveolens]|uniref:uncharacterized protein LOC141711255 n=1 Tax=Apium graveolens TaxID=4045 RepID=UPI003D7B38FD
MQTLNSSKTAEILARYRPIAPKPPPDHEVKENITNPNSNPPEKIRDCGYVRGVWLHMEAQAQAQARPMTRMTRKWGRALLAPKGSFGFSPYLSPKDLLSFLASPDVLLPNYTMAVKDLDLNMHVPVEKDLLRQLQAKEEQVQSETRDVIAPRPIKLVSSAIKIHPRTISNQEVAVQSRSKAKEIEVEMESEPLPTVISDSKNQVRLANSAYNRLVGQPECSWLDSIDAGCGGDAVKCNKICGEVMLQIPDTAVEEFVSTSNGFFCLVVIEWGNSEYKSSITTLGEAVRLFCESRDYMFAWRFHTQGAVTCAPNF